MFSNDFKKYFKWLCVPFIVILLLPILLTKLPLCLFDFSDTGEVGDTIGGIMGPFVAIAAAILTFLAFWVQYKANEQQRKDIALERFENHFFTFINLYNITTNNIIIPSIGKNKQAFHFIFYEYHTLLILFNIFYKEYYNKKNSNKMDDLSSLAISFIMCGTAINSNKNIINTFIHKFNKSFIKGTITLVNTLQNIDNNQLSTLKNIPEFILFNNYHSFPNIKWYWGLRTILITYINQINTQISFINKSDLTSDEKKYITTFYTHKCLNMN